MLPMSPAWPLPALPPAQRSYVFGSSVSAYFADEQSTSPVKQLLLRKLSFKPIQLLSQVDLEGVGEQEAWGRDSSVGPFTASTKTNASENCSLAGLEHFCMWRVHFSVGHSKSWIITLHILIESVLSLECSVFENKYSNLEDTSLWSGMWDPWENIWPHLNKCLNSSIFMKLLWMSFQRRCTLHAHYFKMKRETQMIFNGTLTRRLHGWSWVNHQIVPNYLYFKVPHTVQGILIGQRWFEDTACLACSHTIALLCTAVLTVCQH